MRGAPIELFAYEDMVEPKGGPRPEKFVLFACSWRSDLERVSPEALLMESMDVAGEIPFEAKDRRLC